MKPEDSNSIVELKNDENHLVGVRHAPKYEVNPFLSSLTVTTRGRKLTVARGSVLIDSETGEVDGYTQVAQVVEVDEGQFIKLFTKDMAVWFDLSKAGIRVFGALLATVQESGIGRDLVFFDIRSSALEYFKITKPTFYRGLEELIQKGFIARHLSAGWFFINPAMFFNGDRARFIKEYRKTSYTPKSNAIDIHKAKITDA